MIYEFRRVLAGDRLSSEVIEEDMPYEAAPPIGGRIKLGGKLLQRIASMPPAKVEGDFHFMSLVERAQEARREVQQEGPPAVREQEAGA